MKPLSTFFFIVFFLGCQSVPPSQKTPLFSPEELAPLPHSIQTSLKHLFSPNFLLHSSGAATLIEQGEAAIPYLMQTQSPERIVYDEKVAVIRPVLEKIMNRLTPEQIQLYLQHEHPFIRKTAIHSIAQQHRLTLLPHLQSLEKDPSPEVRQEALLAIRLLSDLYHQQQSQTALAR
jgi:HEAT repeat protein